MSVPKFETFEEFWPYYVREHSKKSTRRLHFAGTSMALGAIGIGLLTGRKSLLALAPVLGYGPAWIGHYFFEGNVPATFSYPLWSLMSDIKMFGKMLEGSMDAEVERVIATYEAAASPPPPPKPTPSHDTYAKRVDVELIELDEPVDPSMLN